MTEEEDILGTNSSSVCVVHFISLLLDDVHMHCLFQYLYKCNFPLFLWFSLCTASWKLRRSDGATKPPLLKARAACGQQTGQGQCGHIGAIGNGAQGVEMLRHQWPQNHQCLCAACEFLFKSNTSVVGLVLSISFRIFAGTASCWWRGATGE